MWKYKLKVLALYALVFVAFAAVSYAVGGNGCDDLYDGIDCFRR